MEVVCCGESYCAGIDMALSKCGKKAISKFLRTHYRFGEEIGQKVKAEEVFSLFQQLRPTSQCSFAQFHSRALAIGVKVKRETRRKAYYYYYYGSYLARELLLFV